MRHTLRLCIFAGAMAVLFGLPPLASTSSNQALGQIRIVVPTGNHSYYNGYSSHYHRGYVQQHGYTGYGIGPYGYGTTTYGYQSTVPYGYRASPEYGYRHSTPYSLYYRGLRSESGTASYRSIYVPPTTRYYSPYGYGVGYGDAYRRY